MKTLQQIYNRSCLTLSNINKHLSILKRYVEHYERITETEVNAAVSICVLTMSNGNRLSVTKQHGL